MNITDLFILMPSPCGSELAREGCLSDVFACLTQRFREQAHSHKRCIVGHLRVADVEMRIA
jgi:hypothetical protein